MPESWKDLDRLVSAGRQLVDGVSGARPGTRSGTRTRPSPCPQPCNRRGPEPGTHPSPGSDTDRGGHGGSGAGTGPKPSRGYDRGLPCRTTRYGSRGRRRQPGPADSRGGPTPAGPARQHR